MDADDRYDLTEQLARLVNNPQSLEFGIKLSSGEWHLYKLEDNRFAVSRFDAHGQQHEEMLFAEDESFQAAAEFVRRIAP